MGYHLSIFNYNAFVFMIRMFIFLFCFLFFFSFPALAVNTISENVDPFSNTPGSSSFPLYELFDGVYRYGYYASSINPTTVKYGVPVKKCLYATVPNGYLSSLWVSYIPPTFYASPPYVSPLEANHPDNPDYSLSIIYSCEIWVLPQIPVGSGSSSNSCDSSGTLSQVSVSIFDRAVSVLPDVPASMRISSILSNLFGGSSLAGYLISQVWVEISPLLLIFVGLKLYKLLPFV
jgi:hypothetical protein